MKQSERLGKSASKHSNNDEGFDIINDASTNGAFSRKGSNHEHTTNISNDQYSQSAVNFEDEEDEDEPMDDFS